MSRRFVAFLGSLALGASLLSVPTLAGADPDESGNTVEVTESTTGSYVVLMEGDPLVISEGKDRVNTRQGRARGQQMRAQQQRAAASVGVETVNEYTVALNGFSSVMSHEEAETLAARKDVRLVVPDELRQPTTDASGDFMGLAADAGAYDLDVKGDGVLVGVIDSGIWPEHPSFADDGSYPEPPITLSDDRPTCEFGNTDHNEADAPFECTNKLVGARQMLDTYRTVLGAEDDEFDSARDDNGHGTHTASTAAGNEGVAASVGRHDLGEVTGVAPRAHIVAYKGLGARGGFGSDLAAAIDQAVADGVDVINYSIGGGPSLIGADDIAYLFAADAGVHVASSAGNSGPGAGTIGGPASVPWLTTVGASTQTRFFQGTVQLGDGTTLTGASLTEGVEESPLVDAEDATEDGDDLCRPGTLDEQVVAGAVVLCQRGAIARVDKSLAVLQAGGVGMVMYEQSDAGDRFTDTHHVPSVHVDNAEGLAIKDYIASADTPTAAIVDTGTKADFGPAPSITSFSSRGPDPVAQDLIKPDVTAPGMQILAGASPYTDPGGNLFQSIAGTSMSSPHVAGLFALMKERNPDWTPAMAKSALMTTAHQDVRDNDRVTPADPFDMGAGHVDPGSPARPGSSFNPGLVYDAGFNDYLGFLCDAAPEVFGDAAEAQCAALADAGIPTSATDLNLPSIGASSVPGSLTITRTVTSTAPGNRNYRVDVDAPEGFDVTVSPSSFRIRKGQSVTYTVDIENVSAPIEEWRHGSLTWRSGRYEAYSPMSLKGTLFDAPANVTGTGESGSTTFDVAFGYTGDYEAAGHGLEPATVFEDQVDQDDGQNFEPGDVDTGGAVAHEFTLTNSARFRLAIPPDAVDSGNVDIDLFLLDEDGAQVASSTNGGTDEQIDLAFPEDGTYTAYVHGWQTGLDPGEGTIPVTLYAWDVSADPAEDDASLTVSGPDQAVMGEVATLEASWTGATLEEWHLGAVSHSDADGLMGLTLVEIDNR